MLRMNYRVKTYCIAKCASYSQSFFAPMSTAFRKEFQKIRRFILRTIKNIFFARRQERLFLFIENSVCSLSVVKINIKINTACNNRVPQHLKSVWW